MISSHLYMGVQLQVSNLNFLLLDTCNIILLDIHVIIACTLMASFVMFPTVLRTYSFENLWKVLKVSVYAKNLP